MSIVTKTPYRYFYVQNEKGNRTLLDEVQKLVGRMKATRPSSLETQGAGVKTQIVSNIGDSVTQAEVLHHVATKGTRPGRSLSSDMNEQDKKRQKIEENPISLPKPRAITEYKNLIECRQRTFSHWTEKYLKFIDLLIDAGFFGCNVGDRVICIYCDTVYQQWDLETDDPREIHRLVSPRCPYLSLMSTSASILGETIIDMDTSNTEPSHPEFTDETARKRTFEDKAEISSTRIQELVQNGFYYASMEALVKCFHCDKALNNWETIENALVCHVKLSPQCQFAKSTCTQDLYQSIISSINSRSSTRPLSVRPSCRQGTAVDDNLLSRLVAARLDLPVSQELLNKNVRLSVIKRVWEDQLRIKHDDFVADIDVHVACLILEKQIKIIDGNKDNVIIPKKKKEQILRQGEEVSRDVITTSESAPIPIAKSEPVVKEEKVEIVRKVEKEAEAEKALDNPCLICKKAEKQLACIPCGHLVTCLSCSQNIRTCPTCRRSIEAYIRVYL